MSPRPPLDFNRAGRLSLRQLQVSRRYRGSRREPGYGTTPDCVCCADGKRGLLVENEVDLRDGQRTPIDVADGISIVRAATPVPFEGEAVVPEGMRPGDPFVVIHLEDGSGSMARQLAASVVGENARRHEEEDVGEVVVHFPREDYAMVALS